MARTSKTRRSRGIVLSIHAFRYSPRQIGLEVPAIGSSSVMQPKRPHTEADGRIDATEPHRSALQRRATAPKLRRHRRHVVRRCHPVDFYTWHRPLHLSFSGVILRRPLATVYYTSRPATPFPTARSSSRRRPMRRFADGPGVQCLTGRLCSSACSLKSGKFTKSLLRGYVAGRIASRIPDSVNRRYVDDLGRSFRRSVRHEPGEQLLGHKKSGLKVEIHHFVPAVFREFPDGCTPACTGVVDQDINRVRKVRSHRFDTRKR